MTERDRGLGIFRSFRKRKKREDENKSYKSQDDSVIAYPTLENMATTQPMPATNEKPAKPGTPGRQSKKSNWTNIFKPWKWRKKKKEKQHKNGDQNGPSVKPSEEDNNTNHVRDSTGPPVKPERSFDSNVDSGGEPRNGDTASRPVVTTEVQINQSEGNSLPNSNLPGDVQNSSSVNSPYGSGDAPYSLPEDGSDVDQPSLPPKVKSPDRSPYRPNIAPRASTESPEPPDNGVKKSLNFSGAEVVGHGAQNEHYEDSDSDYDNNIQYRDEEDDDDEEESSLASKVKRNDSLAFHLSNRPSWEALEERNIIPVVSHNQIKEKRDQVGAKLVRRLSERPSKDELEQRNIYKEPENERIRREALEEKKRTLVRKLSFRPTVEELRSRNIILFNEYVEVIEALVYDRKAEKPWTKLTPQDKAYIRKELNEFKSNEMAVHEDSRKYTRFHKP